MHPRTDPARRPWAWLGIGAVVVALYWPAQPAAGAALQGSDTFSLSSPAAVDASQTTTLVFDYAASGNDPSSDDTVTIAVPPGWSASSASVTCLKSDCQASIADGAIIVSVNLDVSSTFELDVTATAPPYAATSTFTASEQFYGTPPVTDPLAPSQVTVNCPDDGTGTVTVSPASVAAGSTRDLTFTYRASSTCGVGTGGVVQLTVPDTWTPPNTTAGTAGFTTWSGPQLSVLPGGIISVPVGTLGPGQAISIDYEMAQAPGPDPGQYMFGAAEQSSAGGTLTALSAVLVQVTPPFTVTTSPPPPPPPPPAGGAGQLTVAPGQVTASHRGELTFTYFAPQDGLPASGEVSLKVPAGWTLPSPEPGRPGYTRSSAGRLSVSGQTITVTGATLGSGQTLTITYDAATAPGQAGVSTFTASEGPDGAAGLAPLRTSPTVTVTPAGAPAPAPAPSPAIVWLVIGLAAAAGAAGALAIRRLRRGGGHGTGTPTVRAVPHAGPPTTLAIRDTGTRPTLIVRIEPHPGDPVTTIEEARP